MSADPPGTKLPSDAKLPENSKENLDRKLDHAIEETFPTSDPVSVTVTSGGGIDYDQEQGSRASGPQDRSGNAGPSAGDDLVGQVTEAVQGAAEAASGIAREAYTKGERYVRQARERYPEAERYYRQGSQMVREQAAENPILMLLLGLTVGYALGWAIHRGRDGDRERYARTRSGHMRR